MTTSSTTGRCLCGSVRFRIAFPTDFVAHCHCRSCQLAHGAPFVTWTSVPLDRIEFLEGDEALRWYRSSECILWGFCSHCGSSMFYRADREGHHESPRTDCIYISAACLDELDQNPACHVSCEERSRLLRSLDSIPAYRGKTNERIDWSPEGEG